MVKERWASVKGGEIDSGGNAGRRQLTVGGERRGKWFFGRAGTKEGGMGGRREG